MELKTLASFFGEEAKLVQYVSTLERSSSEQAKISLRALDFFLTSFSRVHSISITHPCTGKTFNPHLAYKMTLARFRKKRFDCFCRSRGGPRCRFTYTRRDRQGQFNVFTNLAQLRFFHWAIENGVLRYAQEHAREIIGELKALADKTNCQQPDVQDLSKKYGRALVQTGRGHLRGSILGTPPPPRPHFMGNGGSSPLVPMGYMQPRHDVSSPIYHASSPPLPPSLTAPCAKAPGNNCNSSAAATTSHAHAQFTVPASSASTVAWVPAMWQDVVYATENPHSSQPPMVAFRPSVDIQAKGWRAIGQSQPQLPMSPVAVPAGAPLHLNTL